MAVAAGQTNGFSTASAMAADGSGNLYLVGSFSGTIVFGATALTSAGQTDVFVAKWSGSNQAFEWARQVGGASNEYAGDVAVSGTNIYLTGYYRSNPVQFGSLTLPNGGNGTGDSDVFVAKLTDLGTSADFTWVERLAGTGSDFATGLAVSGNRVYVTGYFNSPVLNAGTVALTNAGAFDVFVAKLTDTGAGGTVGWAQQMGGPGNEQVFALAVTGGQMYVGGGFSGTAAFGANSLTSAGGQDVFVAKLTDGGSSAAFGWAQRAGGTGGDYATSLALAPGAVYVAGAYTGSPASFGGTTLPHAGGTASDAFIAKLTDAGSTAAFAWALGAGGTAEDAPTSLSVQGNNVLMSGYFGSSTMAFGSTTLANPATAFDAFVTRVVDAGATARFAWALRAGGSGQDTGEALTVSGNTIFVAGATNPPATFGSLTIGTPTGTQAPFLASIVDATLTATAAPATLEGLAVFPNPARVSAAVRMPAVPGAAQATLTLLDALGRAVRTQMVPLSAAGLAVEVSVAGLAPGLYRLRVQAGGQQASRALSVE
ncbi:T9SS type A sorting domain-containing protein [Hymenobacter armeniacus]|uniref:T9SS type A sorting domain-containing protein n=1 Tax=Hymenobacter armeniacus TaxID=2771358 RepID=A0ABR8JUT7_9BACT|nr:T9SS type A sorting domain-containing protein [Hymenobacter armeniacus]MBD2723724.1 T9SS type A sorting domain-containing protein [Hymenobacter armeniacus]